MFEKFELQFKRLGKITLVDPIILLYNLHLEMADNLFLVEFELTIRNATHESKP